MTAARPGGGLKTEKMPGHWVLARLGKRVLRPGGMELTRRMLASLGIRESDDVIEFAPGMGVTARLTLALRPASYTAVERDEAAARIVKGYVEGEGFEVKATETAPMALLEPARVVRDEGFFRALRFALNVLRDTDARRRVFEMRRVFRRHSGQITAVAVTAVRV